MNFLERTLIEKAGYSHGWENVRESTLERVILYSSLHKAEAHLTPASATMVWNVSFPKGPPAGELLRGFSDRYLGGDTFQVHSEAELGRFLRRAAELARALPNQAAEDYAREVAKMEANPPCATETLALVKQRRGQELFREALMNYWNGACAVTGIAVPGLLRASHSKPWAACESDLERLNVFNGFLLCAHLDALFDRGLMTFDATGQALFAPSLQPEVLTRLGLDGTLRLRWMDSQHEAFLAWHRQWVFCGG